MEPLLTPYLQGNPNMTSNTLSYNKEINLAAGVKALLYMSPLTSLGLSNQYFPFLVYKYCFTCLDSIFSFFNASTT